MLSFPLQERHIKQAQELYALRSSLLDQPLSSSRSVIDLERRLSIHLNILSQLSEEEYSSTGRDEARFLFFATALQNSDEAYLYETCDLAVDQLADESLPRPPIYDAFTLFPPSIDILLRLYKEKPRLRAEIFSIWRRQNADLPAGLINQAELQYEDGSLQYEVLSYAANHPAYGVDIFRAYYTALLKPAGQSPLPESLFVPVIWGGLVRGDTEAATALVRAIEQAPSTKTRIKLLRMVALTGVPDHIPVLEEAFEYSENFNSRWWALLGMADSVHHLIKQLGQPEQADRAHDDWKLLAGESLPKRPALMLVDESGEKVVPDGDDERHLKMVPDANYATAWLASHRTDWNSDRWIMGQAAGVDWLTELCRHYCGEAVYDLTDLLALKLQRPLGSYPGYGWQRRRIEALDELNSVNAAPFSAHRLG